MWLTPSIWFHEPAHQEFERKRSFGVVPSPSAAVGSCCLENVPEPGSPEVGICASVVARPAVEKVSGGDESSDVGNVSSQKD